MIKVAVRVLPRDVILDTQGRAVEQVLSRQHKPVKSCRVGKYIELEIEAINAQAALSEAKQIAESLLHNPLIEKYELEVVEPET